MHVLSPVPRTQVALNQHLLEDLGSCFGEPVVLCSSVQTFLNTSFFLPSPSTMPCGLGHHRQEGSAPVCFGPQPWGPCHSLTMALTTRPR
jgi:hypothetical protein